MTFEELQDAVLDMRFGSVRRPTVKRVINQQIASLWADYDWAWKRRPPTSVTTVAGTRDMTLTAVTNVEPIENVLGLYDENGQMLAAMANDEFEELYEPLHAQGATGTPVAFTVYGEGELLKIRLGQTPGSAETYTLSYNAAPTTLSADADDLADQGWPAAYHDLIVVSAKIYLTQDESDPTWRELEPARTRLLNSAVEALTTDDAGENLSYGADRLGYERVW